jgi:hypothetical protein
MRISLVLWAGNLVPTDGEYDLDRLADDFAARVHAAISARFPTARVSVMVEDGEGLETAIQVLPPDGPDSEQAETVVRELVDFEWERFDFGAYAATE